MPDGFGERPAFGMACSSALFPQPSPDPSVAVTDSDYPQFLDEKGGLGMTWANQLPTFFHDTSFDTQIDRLFD